MSYHIVLNRPTDLSKAAVEAHAGNAPRHSMAELAARLDAKVHDGAGLAHGAVDRLLGGLTRTKPLWWAIARKLRSEVKPGAVIFCTGEDIGVPVAVLCGRLPGVRVAIMAHYVDRPKGRLALRLFSLRNRVALFMAVARPQARFLETFIAGSPGDVLFITDQTDTKFFSPGVETAGKPRPVIASVGLEQRDYATLAQATADLDLDVRISGFSADTRVLSRAFPPVMPANMTRRFYPWQELVQLYRDADIMVVSLFPNHYAGGVQALMEALSCGRPVVVTATPGLEGYLDRPDAMMTVPPGDAAALRAAIVGLLANPEKRAQMASRAVLLARERYPLERYIGDIAGALEKLQEKAGAR